MVAFLPLLVFPLLPGLGHAFQKDGNVSLLVGRGGKEGGREGGKEGETEMIVFKASSPFSLDLH
jgi:hypothetical protein